MHTVLIVDDEHFIRSLVKNLIDWGGLNLKLIGEAGDGEEALVLIHHHKPDIVITDIRMPKMDGLALVREMRGRQEYSPEFIIISGYKEFDYAYEALKYGAVDFLLKPINGDELNATLSRLLKANPYPTFDQQELKGDNTVVRRQLLVNLHHGAVDQGDLTTQGLNKKYRYYFQEGNFLSCLICVDGQELLKEKEPSFQLEVESLVVKNFSALTYDFGGYVRGGRYSMLINYNPENTQKIKSALEQLLEDIKSLSRGYHFLHVSLGLSLPCKASQLDIGSIQAGRSIDSRSIYGVGKVIDYSSFQEKEVDSFSENLFRKEGEKAQELLDEQGIVAACESFFQQIAVLYKNAPYQVVPLIEYKVRSIIMGTLRHHLPTKDHEYMKQLEGLTFTDCFTQEQLLHKMQQEILTVFRDIQETKKKGDSSTISTVKAYITENMHKQVSLEEVSKEVFLSPSYLGVLFKKETGELFSQYVTQIKTEKAKELLRETPLTFKEIGDQLGYKDVRYFSKQFRTVVGVKPSEYRKLYSL